METFRLITTQAELDMLIPAIQNSDILPIDVETTGLDPYVSKIRLVQLGVADSSYVVDCFKISIKPLVEALSVYKGILVAHNAKFEQKMFLHHYGLVIPKLFDTWRASQIVYNGRETGHNLYDIQKRELGIEPPTADMGATDWSGELSAEQLEYAASDVRYLAQLRDVLKRKIVGSGLTKIAKLEFDAIAPEAAMELAGMPIDGPAWLRLAEANTIRRDALYVNLKRELPNPLEGSQLDMFGWVEDWNLDSQPQLLESLKRNGLELPDTSKLTMAMCDHPIAAKITEYRKANQRVKTFGADWLKCVNPVTGRIHSNYYPFTGAGRYSSSNPNQQQIPRDKEFRSCFKPLAGRCLVISDYSAIELRMVAQLSKDPTLLRIFREGGDPHKMTAQFVTGKTEVTKAERQEAKAINFGYCFGLGAPKYVQYARLNYGVTVTLDQAKESRNKYFKLYPGIKEWHKRCKEGGSTVQTILGRKRVLQAEAHGERMNTPCQGSAADGMKLALRHLWERLPSDIQLCASVHDEIVLEAPIDKAESAKQLLEESMMAGMKDILTDVPCAVECSVGASWAEK